MDEYEYLEDLSDERSKKFIDEMNSLTREKLERKAKELYPIILQKLKEPQIVGLVAYDTTNPTILTLDGQSKVRIGDKTVFVAPQGYVIYQMWKIYNSEEQIGISMGRKGSDKTTTLIISQGEAKKIGENIQNPFYYLGQLCYVKVYRDSAPPDGGDYPTQRVICNDTMVWGKDLKPGEFIQVNVFEDLLAIVKHRGWSYGELFIGESFEGLRKIDEGEVIDVLGVVKGELVYQKKMKL